jgi:hypothetical protein
MPVCSPVALVFAELRLPDLFALRFCELFALPVLLLLLLF